MLRKFLPVLMIMLLWSVAPAQAEDGRPSARDRSPQAEPVYQQRGARGQCYTGFNGRGKIIAWARNKEQCRTQTTGKSWGHSGHFENFTGKSDFRRR